MTADHFEQFPARTEPTPGTSSRSRSPTAVFLAAEYLTHGLGRRQRVVHRGLQRSLRIPVAFRRRFVDRCRTVQVGNPQIVGEQSAVGGEPVAHVAELQGGREVCLSVPAVVVTFHAQRLDQQGEDSLYLGEVRPVDRVEIAGDQLNDGYLCTRPSSGTGPVDPGRRPRRRLRPDCPNAAVDWPGFADRGTDQR
jgi:hypothetical protein